VLNGLATVEKKLPLDVVIDILYLESKYKDSFQVCEPIFAVRNIGSLDSLIWIVELTPFSQSTRIF
jgi:hypothetical protein